MSAIVNFEPSERTQQIVALAASALSGADEVRQRIRRTTEMALECGRLLIEEQAEVKAKHGHGAWSTYFEINFSKVVSDRHARHWMRMAKTAIATLPSGYTPNQLRFDVLTLGAFPPKQHPGTHGAIDAPTNTPPGRTATTLPAHSTHLGLINRFSAWRAWLHTSTGGEMTTERAMQLLSDFGPMVQFVEELRSTIALKPIAPAQYN